MYERRQFEIDKIFYRLDLTYAFFLQYSNIYIK